MTIRYGQVMAELGRCQLERVCVWWSRSERVIARSFQTLPFEQKD